MADAQPNVARPTWPWRVLAVGWSAVGFAYVVLTTTGEQLSSKFGVIEPPPFLASQDEMRALTFDAMSGFGSRFEHATTPVRAFASTLLFVCISMVWIYGPLERAFPAVRARSWWAARTDLAFLVGGYALWNWMALTVALHVIQYLPVPPFRLAVETLPNIAQAVIAILATDLVLYGAHRAQHTIPWLWRWHAVHHSTEHLDWVASHREHPLDSVYTAVWMNLPAGLLGVDIKVLTVLFVMRGLWATFIHTNVDVRLGWLGVLVGEPRVHRHHHTPEGQRTNFANLGPWVDVLFGTYHRPEQLPTELGLGLGMPWAEGYLGLLVAPFLGAPGAAETAPSHRGRLGQPTIDVAAADAPAQLLTIALDDLRDSAQRESFDILRAQALLDAATILELSDVANDARRLLNRESTADFTALMAQKFGYTAERLEKLRQPSGRTWLETCHPVFQRDAVAVQAAMDEATRVALEGDSARALTLALALATPRSPHRTPLEVEVALTAAVAGDFDACKAWIADGTVTADYIHDARLVLTIEYARAARWADANRELKALQPISPWTATCLALGLAGRRPWSTYPYPDY